MVNTITICTARQDGRKVAAKRQETLPYTSIDICAQMVPDYNWNWAYGINIIISILLEWFPCPQREGETGEGGPVWILRTVLYWHLRITYCKGLEGVADLMFINCVLILFIYFFNWWITESRSRPYKTDVFMYLFSCLWLQVLSYRNQLAAALPVVKLASWGNRASHWLLISWRAASVRWLLLSLRWLSRGELCSAACCAILPHVLEEVRTFWRPCHFQSQMCCLAVSWPLMVAPISHTCPSENNAIVIHLLEKSPGSGWGVGESQPVWTKKGTSFISMWSDLPKSRV